MPRRSLGALAALVGALVPFPVPARAAAPPFAPPFAQAAGTGPVLLIEGRGFGHGVGMAQDGAYAMATAGASATDILAQFYPGTSLGRRSGTVRVDLQSQPGTVVVALPGGGEVRDAASGASSPGFPVTVSPGGSVALSFAGGAYRAKPLSGASLSRSAPATAAPVAAPPPPAAAGRATAPSTTAPGLLSPLLGALAPPPAPGPTPGSAPPSRSPAAAPTTAPAVPTEAVSGRGLWAVPKGDSVVALPGQDRRYRGMIQATAGGGGLQLTNVVDVEQYVRGMGEMPASWPAAALQAQAIAARTFAVGAATSGRPLCDTQQCQVYVGAGNESPSTAAAAAATRGKVLLYGGALAEAVYSASGGGVSATPEEGFGPGSPDAPYLRAAPYQTADPQPWAVTVALQQVAGRFGYRGDLTGVRVSRTGPSGRPLEITLDGGDGPMAVDGYRFSQNLSLRSTLYSLRLQSSGSAPGVERLDGLLPGLPSVGAGSPGRALVAVGLPPLGRAPWVGFAAVLLAGWAVAASHVFGRRPPVEE